MLVPLGPATNPPRLESRPATIQLAGDAVASTTLLPRFRELPIVFGHPHNGHPLERGQVSKRFKRTLKRAGVRAIRFHDLPHTFGTRCAAAGVPLQTLQTWMGRADIKTTMVYTHHAPGANEADLINGVFQPQLAQTDVAPNIAER